MDTETTATQETKFVFRRLEESLRLLGRDFEPTWFWVVILLLVLAAAFFYVGWMYKRDSRSVGWAWASLLAALRCTVYLLLAGVFLLPALQTWEKTETRSKVVGLVDVSGSTSSRDDLPSDTVSVEKLPTRQDKVIRFFTNEEIGFLKRLQEKNPVYLYRFGGRLDEQFSLFSGGKLWPRAECETWLKPNPKEGAPENLGEEDKAKFQKRLELQQLLVGGTNLGDSLLEVVNREANNMVQAIVVISDGRSTQFSAQSFEEARLRARKAKVPIMTVAVGEHRQPINILITDLQSPEQARPDDKFLVRVEVDGEGLPNKETQVTLDVTNPKGDTVPVELPLKFNAGAGGPPHAQAEFEIDPAKLGTPAATGSKPELEEGEWVFRARVPKDKREIFLDPEHVSNKATVNVVKKPLRVLLFAGAPSHDFQFVRTHFVREVDQRRAELSVCLQIQRPGVVQDVPQERFLRQFPTLLQAEDAPQEKPEDKYYNLAQYDLIVAFDPDWSKLDTEQLALLEKWVNLHAGGLILVAGPVNTFQLARPMNRDQLKPVLDLFPVILQDSRLSSLGIERPSSEPWRLHFPGATAEMEFLKLDEESKDALAGWEEFFTGQKADSAKEAPTRRGFYSFYPVEGLKPSATVIATFGDPRANMRDGREQPYFVSMPYGSGKVVYLGSGETRRLRQYREAFHERFWTKLARFTGSGNLSRSSRRGVLVMGREFTAGQFVRLEAQLFGRDLQPLAPTAVPKVQLKPPTGVQMPATVDLQAKPSQGGEWNGWFQGRFRVLAPGEYRLDLQIPETGDTLPGRFLVKESNPEMDNTRPDFGQLYQLASDVTEVLPRMNDQAQSELKRALEGTAARLLQHVEDKPVLDPRRNPPVPGQERPDKTEAAESAEKDKTPLRLFFDLTSAQLIPTCMVTDSKVLKSRGPVEDLWDRGFPLWADSATQMSTVLLLVVTLLGVEWLIRKLLKLA